jgi:2-succinyl-5-enolpyruvyl-6-hydroxy-3-cyclohexene-1-carboxylate synthase
VLAAARDAERLRLLILDNGGGGIFHFLPQAEAVTEEEFEALLGTPSRLDLARAMELFGLSSVTPSAPVELDQALGGDARAVIVRTDRSRNLELHHRLSEAASAAVAAI